MSIEVVQGILIPFAGTSLGAACVFFMQRTLRPIIQRALTGFAAGVMVAAVLGRRLLVLHLLLVRLHPLLGGGFGDGLQQRGGKYGVGLLLLVHGCFLLAPTGIPALSHRLRR